MMNIAIFTDEEWRSTDFSCVSLSSFRACVYISLWKYVNISKEELIATMIRDNQTHALVSWRC